MPVNEGMVALSDMLKRKVEKPPEYPDKKFRKLLPFQEMALKVLETLKIRDKKSVAIIFKTCKRNENNLAFIEHCLCETKELANGDKKANYFIKIICEKGK